MNYTVSLLMSAADCQALIDLANKEKQSLQYRKTGIERQRQSATLTSAEIESELTTITLELQALQAVYATLPEGEAKQQILDKITVDQFKKYQLEKRKSSYGVLSLLQKEHDIACIERSIVETDDYIAQVTARMNAI